MDLEEFRSFVLDSGVDVWTWIDMAISMASSDYETELKERRDGIIQKLYAPKFSKCKNCDHQLDKTEESRKKDAGRDSNTEMLEERKMAVGNEDDEEEHEEQRKVDEIKILLDDQNQDESCLIALLQRLVDMDISFKVLKETDIGRHVTQFRKHSSNEVRRLVKILVRKWKDTVDEWVRMSSPMGEMARFNAGDRESTHGDANSPYYSTPQKGKVIDKHIESDNYSATERIQSDHQEDQHAKRQRTGQALNFQHVPKVTNPLVTSNRGRVPVKY